MARMMVEMLGHEYYRNRGYELDAIQDQYSVFNKGWRVP